MSVSVFIPTWNRADTLGRAIVSAASQNPAEVVVIDDASTDGTPEIVEQLQGIYHCVRLVRHKCKSQDWQQAAAEHFSAMAGTHVIALGADDRLEDGVVDSVNRYSDAAVVFHDYWVAKPGQEASGLVALGVDAVTTLSPEQVQHRITHRPYACETGIGSAIRRDCLLWLNAHHWWRMGPWSDAIGYAAIAASCGAVYVPCCGATFTSDDAGYGASNRTGALAPLYHKAVRRFLKEMRLPFSVAASIMKNRGVPPCA